VLSLAYIYRHNIVIITESNHPSNAISYTGGNASLNI